MALKLVPQHRIEAARNHPSVYWNGGPPVPPDDGEEAPGVVAYAERLEEFFAVLAESMFLSHAMRWVKMDRYEFASLINRSPWFCERINAIVDEKAGELVLASIQRAIGYTVAGEDGKLITDASGAVLRKGASDAMARLFLEQLGTIQAPLSAASPSPDPSSPHFREDERQRQISETLAIIAAHRPASMAGDAKASEIIIKAQDRLAKLAGLDQPRLVATFDARFDVNKLGDEQLLAIIERAAGGEFDARRTIEGEGQIREVPDADPLVGRGFTGQS